MVLKRGNIILYVIILLFSITSFVLLISIVAKMNYADYTNYNSDGHCNDDQTTISYDNKPYCFSKGNHNYLFGIFQNGKKNCVISGPNQVEGYDFPYLSGHSFSSDPNQLINIKCNPSSLSIA